MLLVEAENNLTTRDFILEETQPSLIFRDHPAA